MTNSLSTSRTLQIKVCNLHYEFFFGNQVTGSNLYSSRTTPLQYRSIIALPFNHKEQITHSEAIDPSCGSTLSPLKFLPSSLSF